MPARKKKMKEEGNQCFLSAMINDNNAFGPQTAARWRRKDRRRG
jgi:hypothetical protein